jgi:hypothetical protein
MMVPYKGNEEDQVMQDREIEKLLEASTFDVDQMHFMLPAIETQEE